MQWLEHLLWASIILKVLNRWPHWILPTLPVDVNESPFMRVLGTQLNYVAQIPLQLVWAIISGSWNKAENDVYHFQTCPLMPVWRPPVPSCFAHWLTRCRGSTEQGRGTGGTDAGAEQLHGAEPPALLIPTGLGREPKRKCVLLNQWDLGVEVH